MIAGRSVRYRVTQIDPANLLRGVRKSDLPDIFTKDQATLRNSMAPSGRLSHNSVAVEVRFDQHKAFERDFVAKAM
jgi:hypothetical protein